MSKIIAFPKSRCQSHGGLYTKAKVNARQLSHGCTPVHVRKNSQRPDTIEPIWKARTQGVLLSVVIPTGNRPHLLNRCLAALSVQTLDASRFEIIVVDDMPSHATREVVQKWAIQLGSVGPHITYIPCAEPHGPAAARNRGWAGARGMLIAFTDDCALPHRDWLEKGLNAFDGIAQAVSGRIVTPLAGLPTDYERQEKALEQAEFAGANCFCFKHLLEQLGGFDERFGDAARGDADLYFRLLQANVSIARAPDAVVEHTVQPAAWGVSLAQQKKMQFDALLFKKHPDLYREKVRPAARWDYYAIVILFLMAIVGIVLRESSIAAVAGASWILLTTRLFLQRLRGTVKSASHITEMALTSLVIPPLAVFWRLIGAMRFRVRFA